jgi:hypothetical protein
MAGLNRSKVYTYTTATTTTTTTTTVTTTTNNNNNNGCTAQFGPWTLLSGS